jgi:flavodoxin
MGKKILIVYYSRKGTTKRVGEYIAQNIQCDSEEIIDTKRRDGIIGYLRSGKEAMGKIPSVIKPVSKDPANYDLIIIGTPVWASNMSSPIRAYLKANALSIKKAAFFCTQGGRGGDSAFKEMEALCGKKPVDTLILSGSSLKNENGYKTMVKSFINRIVEVK